MAVHLKYSLANSLQNFCEKSVEKWSVEVFSAQEFFFFDNHFYYCFLNGNTDLWIASKFWN